jgi:glycosyltransferase involved in cell wall biosynthesis
VEPDDKFIFLGSFPHKETASIYRACDIFILPSEGEGFPLSVQEAMASGLPIITTDDEGYRPYNFDRTLLHLIKPTTMEIKRDITYVVSDESLQKAMSKYSSVYARRYFDWNTTTTKLVGIYEQAMA